MNRRATSILLAVNGVLAAGLALLWLGPGSSTDWAPPAAQPPNLEDALASALRPRPDAGAEFPRIAERPLFSSTRRPPEPADASAKSDEPPPPPPPVQLDKLKMYGTINGPTMQGILAEVEGESRFIRSGEKVGEWTLRGISSGEATFAKDDEERIIPLPLAEAPGAAAPAAAATPRSNTRAARPATTPRANRASQRAARAPVARPPASPAEKPAADAPAVRGSWGP